MLSVLIPVFNEKEAIEGTIRSLDQTLSGAAEDFEIVVIDDGSTDGTAGILKSMNLPRLHVITHPENLGYSSSLKTGIRRSRGDLIGIIDADGTYPIADMPMLLGKLRDGGLDMVVGARTKAGAKIPFMRRPAKAVVNALANFLVGRKIADLNSGMRIFTRALGEQFMHLYPQRFSFTITITLAALTNGYLVAFVPIDYFTRKGRSTMRGISGVGNFFSFLALIIRIVTYFRPLRFFALPSIILLATGGALMIVTIARDANISDAGLFLFVTGIQIGLFGLLAEAVARQRQSR